MRGLWTMVVVAAASLLSGCATGSTREEISRLQSQVGLLEERVEQLERSTVGDVSANRSSSESPTETASGTAAAVVVPQQSPAARRAASASAAAKPSTREIQQALKNAGFYPGEIDGKMGPLTREAIREFQRVHGLTEDGVVGKQTWAKLHAYVDLAAGSDELRAPEVLK